MSESEHPTSAPRDRVTATGSDGCESTGASSAGSVDMARANPPVKHMPTAPTPGPPHSSWAWRARARSQSMAGGVVRRAKARNSREMHTLGATFAMFAGVLSAPGSPKRTGMNTVWPRSTTRRANPATAGVMPGISAITMTAVPLPARYTSRRLPPKVNVSRVKSVRASVVMRRR